MNKYDSNLYNLIQIQDYTKAFKILDNNTTIKDQILGFDKCMYLNIVSNINLENGYINKAKSLNEESLKILDKLTHHLDPLYICTKLDSYNITANTHNNFNDMKQGIIEEICKSILINQYDITCIGYMKLSNIYYLNGMERSANIHAKNALIIYQQNNLNDHFILSKILELILLTETLTPLFHNSYNDFNNIVSKYITNQYDNISNNNKISPLPLSMFYFYKSRFTKNASLHKRIQYINQSIDILLDNGIHQSRWLARYYIEKWLLFDKIGREDIAGYYEKEALKIIDETYTKNSVEILKFNMLIIIELASIQDVKKCNEYYTRNISLMKIHKFKKVNIFTLLNRYAIVILSVLNKESIPDIIAKYQEFYFQHKILFGKESELLFELNYFLDSMQMSIIFKTLRD